MKTFEDMLSDIHLAGTSNVLIFLGERGYNSIKKTYKDHHKPFLTCKPGYVEVLGNELIRVKKDSYYKVIPCN